jgi:hypothetical protein
MMDLPMMLSVKMATPVSLDTYTSFAKYVQRLRLNWASQL